jgi:pimeloyl-ACP methyl ester carboxylesterase
MVRDQIALLSVLGYRSTAMMVGHDHGSLMAGLGALIRPDMFPRLTLIGGGFGGPPSFPFNAANGAPTPHPWRLDRCVAGISTRRNSAVPPTVAEQLTFSGRTIDVPAQAIVGRQDWGANRTVGGPMNIGKTGYTQFNELVIGPMRSSQSR